MLKRLRAFLLRNVAPHVCCPTHLWLVSTACCCLDKIVPKENETVYWRVGVLETATRDVDGILQPLAIEMKIGEWVKVSPITLQQVKLLQGALAESVVVYAEAFESGVTEEPAS